MRRPNRSDSITTDLRVGIFHPWTLSRDASGLCVYTRQLAKSLSKRTPTELYSIEGEIPDEIEESPLAVNTITFRAIDPPLSFPSGTPVVVSHQLNRYLYYSKSLTQGVRDHIRHNVDLIVTNDYLDEIFISRVIGVPTVRIIHGKQYGIGNTIRKSFSRSLATVANSTHTAQSVNNSSTYISGIVPPGVNLERFHPNYPPSFCTNSFDVLYAGRITDGKGAFDIIRAISQLSSDVTLHIVGRGQIDRAMNLANQLGIENRITFHGTVDHEMMPRYYAACDVFCNPSHYESFGIVNIEAMACGVPVVTSDLDGVQEYLSNGETGMVFCAGDVDALATVIERLVTSPGLRKDLGKNGKEVAKEYSWDASAKKLLHILHQVTGTVN